jgi:hypothetical protein
MKGHMNVHKLEARYRNLLIRWELVQRQERQGHEQVMSLALVDHLQPMYLWALNLRFHGLPVQS